MIGDRKRETAQVLGKVACKFWYYGAKKKRFTKWGQTWWCCIDSVVILDFCQRKHYRMGGTTEKKKEY